MGVRAVELDVMLCGDNAPVIFHDRKLQRTTDGEGRVSEASLAEIQALDAGSWFAPEFAGARVPGLEEVLELVSGLGMGLNLEIKPARGQERETALTAAATLDRCWPGTLPLLISSSSETALEVMAGLPGHPALGLISGAVPRDWRARLERLDCVSLHAAQAKLSTAQAEAIRRAGFGLLAHTVNDPARAREMFQMGINGIFTDHPERMDTLC